MNQLSIPQNGQDNENNNFLTVMTLQKETISFIHFSFNCQGKKWKHPFDPNLVFDVPDQIDTINTLPGGVLNTKTSLIETTDDYKKSMSVDVGLDVNTVEYGAYSASGSYKKAQENLVNTTKSIVQVSVEMRMISNMA